MFVGQHATPDRRARPHALRCRIWSAERGSAIAEAVQLMLADRAGEF